MCTNSIVAGDMSSPCEKLTARHNTVVSEATGSPLHAYFRALEAPGSPVPHYMRDAVHILKAHRVAVLDEEPVLVLVDRLPPFPFFPHRPCIGVSLSRER